MDKRFVFFATLGAFLILCQWFVFASSRRYLFQRDDGVTRKVAYPVLAALGLLNLTAVLLVFNPSLLPPDTFGRKAATVAFFGYLALVLVICLFFLILGTVSQVLNFKDFVMAALRSTVSRREPLGEDQRGCVGSLPGREACSPDTGESPRNGADMASTSASDHISTFRPSRGAVARYSSAASPTRRAFLKWSAAAGLTSAVGLGTYGVAQAYHSPVVEEFDVFHPQLRGLDRPMTLIQITDFHFGLFVGSPELEKLVNQVNSIAADALIITGDLFHSHLSPVEPAIPILQGLRPRRLGNFAVMGNHDFYAGELRTVKSIRESGITLLRDKWITFEEGDARIHLGGIDDPLGNWLWGKEFPAFRSFMGALPKTPGMRVLLSHRPSILPLASLAGMDLVLAGHTHGGQIILPGGPLHRGVSLARVASQYTHGWYQRGRTRMYLNRGIGLTFVPWRINCPPEVAVFRLCLGDGTSSFAKRRGSSGRREFPLEKGT